MLLVLGEAVWWVKQPVVMNISYLFNESDKDGKKEKQQTLPLLYALNKPLWQLGIIPKPNFVEIPAGKFEMGSNKSESEQPVHTVTIQQAFIMKSPLHNTIIMFGGCSNIAISIKRQQPPCLWSTTLMIKAGDVILVQ